jgi:hypothetical protein
MIKGSVRSGARSSPTSRGKAGRVPSGQQCGRVRSATTHSSDDTFDRSRCRECCAAWHATWGSEHTTPPMRRLLWARGRTGFWIGPSKARGRPHARRPLSLPLQAVDPLIIRRREWSWHATGAFVRRPAYPETDLGIYACGRPATKQGSTQAALGCRNNSDLSAIGRNPFNPH